MNPAVHWKREIMFWLVTVPITFPKGWVAVEDIRVATKLLCNLFGYEYSTPHGKWDHPFWTVDERPLPAAGGGQFATSAKHMVEVAMVKLEERHTLRNAGISRSTKQRIAPRGAHRRQSAASDYVTAAQAAVIGSTTFMGFAAGGESATFKVAKVLSLPELFLGEGGTVHRP